MPILINGERRSQVEDEMKIPYVPLSLIEYLEETYSRANCLREIDAKSAEESLGILKGINIVIEQLKYFSKANDN